MDVSFEQIKDMTMRDFLKLAQDRERLQEENTYLKTKYPKAKEELEKEEREKDDFDINKFIESLYSKGKRRTK